MPDRKVVDLVISICDRGSWFVCDQFLQLRHFPFGGLVSNESDGYDGFRARGLVIACEHAVVVCKRVGSITRQEPEVRKPARSVDVIPTLWVLLPHSLKTTAGKLPGLIVQGHIGVWWMVFT